MQNKIHIKVLGDFIYSVNISKEILELLRLTSINYFIRTQLKKFSNAASFILFYVVF